MQRFQLGDIGVPIRVLVTLDGAAVDISGATTRQIKIKPVGGAAGTMKTFTAAFETNGTDGRLLYATIAGDLPTSGRWNIQARLASASFDYQTEIGEFEVAPNLVNT